MAYQTKGYSVVLKTLSSTRPAPSGQRVLDELLRELALVAPVESDNAGRHQTRWLSSPESRVITGHRILIMPVNDPIWEGHKSFFTEVFRADDSPWKAWERRGESAV